MALVGESLAIGTASTTLMTVGATLEASLHSLLINNPTGGDLNCTLSFFDSSTSSEQTLLTQTVSSQTTLKAFPAPVNMAAGDKVNASASGSGLIALVSRFENSSTPAAVGFTARGNYTATTTYATNDVVFLESDSNSYLSRTDSNLNNIPSSNPSNWQIFGAKGEAGSISANPTLVNPVLSGDFTTASGNFDIDPATQIVEIKGNGSDTEGQIKLNCHANTHGQTIKAQPHSEGVTNTSLLPKGASSTLVSEAGTATLTNKTFDIVTDSKGDIRDLNVSRTVTATAEIALTDLGQMVQLNSAGVQALIPSASNMTGAFSIGDIVSVVNTTSTTGSITSQINSFVGGQVATTGTITLGANGIANIYFVSADGCIITGNVS